MTKLQSKILSLEDTCRAIVAEKRMKNARQVFAQIRAYRKKDRPYKTEYRERTQRDCDKRYINSLQEFIDASNAPTVDYISFAIEWKKSSTWGWNPRVYSHINGFHGESYASGCGYDKLSSAVSSSLHSPAWRRFAIENMHKLKKCYGFNMYDGMPGFCFGGCGMSTLESALKALGWKRHDWSCRSYDKQGSTIAGNYSKK